VNRGDRRTGHDRALRVSDDTTHRSRGHTLSGGTTGRQTHDEHYAQRTSHPSSNLHFSLSFRKGFRTGRFYQAMCDVVVSIAAPPDILVGG
jgi:hypothetical protein